MEDRIAEDKNSIVSHCACGIVMLHNSILAADDIELLSRKFINAKWEEGGARVLLAGRASVCHLVLSKGLSVVMRKYLRGGLVKKLTTSNFIFPLSGQNFVRSFVEYRTLDHLRSVGVKVVLPVAALYKKNGIFYEAALVTREVLGPSLSELLQELRNLNECVDGGRLLSCLSYSYLSGIEAKQALTYGIFHSDLHPGNVVCALNDVRLLDFDKAKKIKACDISSYIELLLERWERSIEKLMLAKSVVTSVNKCFKAGLLLDQNDPLMGKDGQK